MSDPNYALACCSSLVEQLARAGLRHAVLSPGSRSTPIALALDRHSDITVHVYLDERAGAFFALGIAKATRTPVVVACTSGTAVAELYPAVVEASQSRTPLVLLTADRPARLRGTGANQTIFQAGLFGQYVRFSEDLSPPSESAKAMTAWGLAGYTAMQESMKSPAGPIHLNLQFEEPLVPSTSPSVHTPKVREPISPKVAAVPDVAAAVEELSGARVVVVAGSMSSPPRNLLLLADAMGWPVIAEPTSGARLPGFALSAGQSLLASEAWMASHPPQTVLLTGAAPTTRATQRVIASAGRLVVVDDEHLDPDSEGRRNLRIHLDADAFGGALLGVPLEPSPDDHRESWLRADAIARSTIDGTMDGWSEPFEGRIARDLAASMPDGGMLVVGSSMPVRDLDLAMAPRESLRVLANRGASGIDGFVSTVLGVAATGTGRTVGLMGDLTFLHDVGGFLWNSAGGIDAVLVVNDNGGGTIFSFLPQRDLPELERLFVTPHRLDLDAIVGASGARHTRVERARDFLPAMDRAVKGGGVHVVLVSVDAKLNRERHAELQTAVDAALS